MDGESSGLLEFYKEYQGISFSAFAILGRGGGGTDAHAFQLWIHTQGGYAAGTCSATMQQVPQHAATK